MPKLAISGPEMRVLEKRGQMPAARQTARATPAADARIMAAEACRGAKIIAVIVSRDRPDDLRRTVEAVRCQAGGWDLTLLIVDSSEDPSTAEALAEAHGTVLLRSAVNLGGAGGYALGMLHALAGGAHWIWLMDDDGRPLHADALTQLLGEAERRQLDAVAPVVMDTQNQSRFAFPYPRHRRYAFTPGELGGETFISGVAHLFNGLLLRAPSLFKTGLPDMRLFIRGDEIDFLHRMRRAGLAFGTTIAARFCHPSSNGELFPVFGGRLQVVYPAPRWKRRNQYRNRAYNYRMHGQFLILAVDCLRYPYFFLVERAFDLAGLREWLGCTWEGLRGDVYVEPVIDLMPRVK